MTGITKENMRTVFNPRGVAVVGATERPGSVGRTVCENLLYGYSKEHGPNPFEFYPVNPTRTEVLGCKCYPSVSSIDTGLCEQVVVITPASKCANVVRDCVKNTSVKSIVIIAAGFKEVGEEGLKMEQELVAIASAHGVCLVGPNCLGVQCPTWQLNATFAADSAPKGHVAFISQSGAMCTAVLDWALAINLGFSAFVSIGSMSHVEWSHCIEYLGEDESTNAIIIYMESIGNASAFMRAAREVSKKKPIVVIKAGKSEAASAAAVSHTGSLAGSHDAFIAAMHRAGCLVVNTIDELQHVALLSAMQPKPTGDKVVIITNAGGPGVLSTDAASEAGLDVCHLDAALVDSMSEFLPAAWSHANPVDVLGDAKADVYAKCVELVMEKGPKDASILVVLSPQSVTEPDATAQAIVEAVARKRSDFPNPVVCAWMGGNQVTKGRATLMANGVPAFGQPDIAASALGLLWNQVKAVRDLASIPVNPLSGAKAAAEAIIAVAQKENRTILTEHESKAVMKAYGIPVAESIVCATSDEAVAAANQLRYPCVIKLNSETITHKSDVGGVKLNIRDEASVREAFDSIKVNVDKIGAHHFQGVSVQPMLDIASGVELLIGSNSDVQFGPMCVFGAGGCLVEIFKDASMSVPPLDESEALHLVNRTKISKALEAGHGERFKGCPRDELLASVQNFSFAVCDLYKDVAECEINPLLALPNRVIALDARVVLRSKDDTSVVAPPCLI